MFKLTASDIVRRVKVGVDRDDLEDLYVGYVNQAIREIENRCSFNYMKASSTVILSSGDLSVSMPDDYKEITRLTYPVVRVPNPPIVDNSVPTVVPVVLYSRQQFERLQQPTGWSVLTNPYLQRLGMLLDVENGKWFLSLLYPATEDIHLRVNYYAYSEEIVEDDPEHPLFTIYPNLVVACTRFMIFADVNDPQKDESEKQYERFLLIAKGNDRGIAFSGFDSHM